MAIQTPANSTTTINDQRSTTASVVVCSLEPWGEVRRRIRILVDEIVDLQPALQLLYVAPAVDIPHQLRRGRADGTPGPRLRQVHPRIHVLRPRKWLPRALGPFADRSLERQVLAAVGALGMGRPLLWVNDAGYAPLAVRTGWPCLYDITDDWLLGPLIPGSGSGSWPTRPCSSSTVTPSWSAPRTSSAPRGEPHRPPDPERRRRRPVPHPDAPALRSAGGPGGPLCREPPR